MQSVYASIAMNMRTKMSVVGILILAMRYQPLFPKSVQKRLSYMLLLQRLNLFHNPSVLYSPRSACYRFPLVCIRSRYILHSLTSRTETGSKRAVFSLIEPAVFIIAGCLATMRPLFVKLRVLPEHMRRISQYRRGTASTSDDRGNSMPSMDLSYSGEMSSQRTTLYDPVTAHPSMSAACGLGMADYGIATSKPKAAEVRDHLRSDWDVTISPLVPS